MENIVILIIYGTFITGISIFIGRAIYKAKIIQFMKSCDHKICDKFCEVERERDMLKKDAQWVRQDRDKKMDSILDKLNEI